MTEYIYSWEFDDTKNRSALWYIIALSVVIWLVIWWILTKQYGMSFIILLIAWIFYFVENNAQDIISVKISNLWVSIENNFYDFTSIESYWLVYNKETPELARFYLKKKWIRYIDVKVNQIIANDLKNVLNNYITELPKIELTFTEKIIKLLNL